MSPTVQLFRRICPRACLYGTILGPVAKGSIPKYPNQATQRHVWNGDAVALATYLGMNKEYGHGNQNLVIQMFNFVGVPARFSYSPTDAPYDPPSVTLQPPLYPEGDYYLFVFDGCKSAKKKLDWEVPTPSFAMNVMRHDYGIEITQETYNKVVGKFWDDPKALTGCTNAQYCVMSSNFGKIGSDIRIQDMDIAPKVVKVEVGVAEPRNITDCGCNEDFMDLYLELGSEHNPLAGSYLRKPKKDDPNTFKACMHAVKAYSPLSPGEVRAAIAVCFGYSFWNTGLGVTWDGGWNGTGYETPLLENLVAPKGFAGPEFLFPIATSSKYNGILCEVGSF